MITMLEEKNLYLGITNSVQRITKLLKCPPKGYSNSINSSGDKVKEIDILANNVFEEELQKIRACTAIASEELPEIKQFYPTQYANNEGYVAFIDPIDGSANIGTNNPVGSIFAFTKPNDVMKNGRHIVLSGYVLYGTQTIMVTVSNGIIKEYLLKNGEFYLTTSDKIKCPDNGKLISINSGNFARWDQKTIDWFDYILDFDKGTFRYTGCFVADVHRILHEGGIFSYPIDRKNKSGKLRLMFECNPIAHIFEAAGGKAINNEGKDILDIQPSSLHSCSSIFVGSKDNINIYKNHDF